VKISRFAIDGKAPHSDLYSSPGHASYIDDILIPASNLVNGVTIVADARAEIFHIDWTHTKLSWRGGWQSEVFGTTTHMHRYSTMQTSMSDYTARPGSLRHPLRWSSVIVVAAKSWHRICAPCARLRFS